jgi:hypothetical protein
MIWTTRGIEEKKCDWARSLFKEKGSPGKAFVIIKSSEVPELKKKTTSELCIAWNDVNYCCQEQGT